ncbi:MAG: YraN family protein [Saprospiraceae bacterium]|nr:YraN family protein [Saprospiraceae bacterium]
MSIQQNHGAWGEGLAVTLLEQSGLVIVVRNWRYKRAEIDIIARENGVLVFVEVKTRAYSAFGLPEEMVDQRKRKLLIDAAMAYMRSVGHEWEIRFDIVSVLGEPGKPTEIKHFRDAFFPGLDYS